MPVTFQGGRLAPVRTKPRLKLRPFLTAAPAPLASVDWYSKVTGWPMFLNDEIGDCTAAMVSHNIQNTSTYGDGETVTVTDDDVLAAYSRVSGYRPGRPDTDRGAVLQDVYADWRKTGIAGHKALAFAEVEPSDVAEVKTAIHTFGAVGVGMTVTERLMDDFNAGLGWTRTGGRSLGGHAVVAVGYDADGLDVVTWGQVIRMSWAVWRRAVDEAWIAVVPEWINDTTNLSPLGVDLYGLGEAMSALTGDANPFRPDPDSGPVPPGPAPRPDEADVALARSMRQWLQTRDL
ncbi:hypothetical protein [Actinomadura decatromicini]|uniref:Uncharacterized protein n=1 Tax=Actinomadura decatromicini TaxID=2604572 RepID=A0A5D3FBM1_9ACTN|nr:hypothetical protein [Actinomadura decatromicini]TYK45140.1 hypothetical protein FXF68_31155 [Actinomadura decatromicini]